MKTKILTVLALGLLIGADAKEDARADQKKLQGKWLLTSAVLDGTEVPGAQLKGEVVFKDNKYSYRTGDADSGSGTFTLDPSKKPKAMNSVPADGPLKGETVEEIYEVDGDNLKICMALPGSKRPTEFKAEAGSNRWMFTYKRAK
jgi:uncharacterized protein (TIGR03067 family)